MTRPPWLYVYAVALAACATSTPPQARTALPAPQASLPDARATVSRAQPLPEHPRPDFERERWVNLNGVWDFALDPANEGEAHEWFRGGAAFDRSIMVPFSWAAPLSGVEGQADYAWYRKRITIPGAWEGQRVFFVIGASDWRTTVWLDGQKLGVHEGGYTPFEFELTQFGAGEHVLVIHVDDAPRAFKLEGKQGYGQARGIWQTPYLEARGPVPVQRIAFYPEPAHERVRLQVRLQEATREPCQVTLTCGELHTLTSVPVGAKEASLVLDVPNPRLWTLEDPHLYTCEVTSAPEGRTADVVKTYFGMRTISVVDLPTQGHPYVALNGKPVYLQMVLDQAYHPTGFYTFPSDDFIREDVERTRRLGLNTMRVHVKVPLPRKLYWADKLGVLIMADVPNAWGDPDDAMFRDHATAMRGMMERDFNHPAIFAWVLFNETWGLLHKDGVQKVYRPATQARVAEVFAQAKALDPTRLIEDNSANLRDHVVTDLNTWHEYLAGPRWQRHIAEVVEQTHPGSPWNFVAGKTQGHQPLLNSEFGNVWGYEGNTGDCDWSWDYHMGLNAFRRHPKVAGWLYTEHHDVINEWNGYYRFDRTPKETGLEELMPGMSLRDLHRPIYIVVGETLSEQRKPGETVQVPLWASFYESEARHGKQLHLRTQLHGWDALARHRVWSESTRPLTFVPWQFGPLPALQVRMPDERAVAVFTVALEDAAGVVLARNFTTFVVPADGKASLRDRDLTVSTVPVGSAKDAKFSQGHHVVLGDKKFAGIGTGSVTYAIPLPKGGAMANAAVFLAEVSTRPPLGKDRGTNTEALGSYMRGAGAHDPSLNKNAYPMTDRYVDAGAVNVWINGDFQGRFDLPDDPADHRGILSWHFQPGEKRLWDAGTYGYRLEVPLTAKALASGKAAGTFEVRLEVADQRPTGLAVYGASFGRYPLDPSIVMQRTTQVAK
ncbi:MAG: glycoside hydrolase family 2 TIM barrel-domain containing protein [Deltaproteobacteria bacterium]|nr:glycoside hydrolase family 2 TIM barrel-domain containing protein [Deltaproteobacteria bacterium]